MRSKIMYQHIQENIYGEWSELLAETTAETIENEESIQVIQKAHPKRIKRAKFIAEAA